MRLAKSKLMAVYLLGLALGVGGWALQATGSRAQNEYFELTVTTHPAVLVRILPQYRPTHRLKIRPMYGSDTRATVYLVPK